MSHWVRAVGGGVAGESLENTKEALQTPAPRTGGSVGPLSPLPTLPDMIPRPHNHPPTTHLENSAANTCAAHMGSVRPTVSAKMNRLGLDPGSSWCLATVYTLNSTSSRKAGSSRPKDRPMYNLQVWVGCVGGDGTAGREEVSAQS